MDAFRYNHRRSMEYAVNKMSCPCNLPGSRRYPNGTICGNSLPRWNSSAADYPLFPPKSLDFGHILAGMVFISLGRYPPAQKNRLMPQFYLAPPPGKVDNWLMCPEAAAPGLVIRSMSRPELDLVLDWAAAEGWNPGLNDADCFYVCDPQGFFLGLLDGEPVAAIAALAYDATLGFLSFYLVKPDLRGRGFGLRLWQAALKHLAGRNLGLDAVAGQVANYAKSGFRVAYRNFYYRGAGGGQAPAGLLPLSRLPFKDLVAYDAAFFPSPRPQFLACWLKQPEGAALGAVPDGRLAGYGVLRACRRGFKIGPLLADRPEIARDLLNGLLARAAGAPVFINMPEANPLALALAEAQGLDHFATTAACTPGACRRRPWRGSTPTTSFEDFGFRMGFG
jgi:ribosomal protein S18 acetylase RimI-like enzyme